MRDTIILSHLFIHYLYRCVYICKATKESQSSPKHGGDPVKDAARCSKWTVRANQFVTDINKVLRTPINGRKQAWTKMMDDTELPLSVSNKLQLSRFLDGQLVIWSNKKILTPTEDKPDYMTCAACESEFKWSKCE